MDTQQAQESRSLTRDELIRGGAFKFAEEPNPGRGACLGSVGYASGERKGVYVGAQISQGEIEREIHRLLITAEALESLVDKAVKTVEKVTRGEPETLAGGKGAGESPIPATMLGRDLDSINGRLQSSMNILQSTIQRIEL